MRECPCGSGAQYGACCGQYVDGSASPPTAEALMRSRYCAYVQANIDYLEQTLLPGTRKDFDRASATAWAKKSTWQGLDILNVTGGKEGDERGTVEFIARYSEGEESYSHHETASFRKRDGNWYFVDGKMMTKPYRREQAKIGRNQPCPCGSGKKFKKCCAIAD